MKAQTLLVVDDNVEFVHVLGEYFKSRGWKVIPAGSELECWQQLKSGKPDVILLDMLLPDAHGLQIAQCLRADAAYRHIPILAMTGLHSPAVRGECFEAGCNDVIVKPFSLKELHKRLSCFS
jgi:CheY-like chemotaxis protein